jgi:HEAT repeat protein
VLAELDNDNNEIRFEAARACGELEISEAAPKLIALIDEADDAEVQEISIWALGRIGGQTAREALEACTESENEALALAAEESLEELSLFTDALDMFDFDDELDDISPDILDEPDNFYLN